MTGNGVHNSAWDNRVNLVQFSHDRHVLGTRPLPRTSFFGREHELERVRSLLAMSDVRVVTLTGPGGVGKTRLSLGVVSPDMPSHRFVDLSDVREPALVLPTIAAALGIRPDLRSPIEQLADVLTDDEFLLLLDNFEQVLPAVPMLSDLLDLCPQLKLLVTSRAVLGLAGERVIDIQPLPLAVAEGSARLTADTAAINLDACKLFEDRAKAVSPGFALTSENASIVLDICKQVDGLPLAIELAASWTSVLTLRSLQSQLESRLSLLGDVAPRAHQRHRSLRDTIAWSYGLLDDPSQHLFQQMAVFQGGCSLDALKYVSRDDSDRLLKALRVLVSNSLVRLVSSSAGESRYSMLETVREYGLECLTESGAAEASFRRHAEWFLMAAEQAERHQNTLDRDVWLDSLEEDLGNVHAALAWTIEHNGAAMAMAFCGALLPLWQHRFHSETGRTWVERAMALSAPAPVESVRKAYYCAGTLAYMHHDVEQAGEHFLRALNGFRGAGDPAMTGRVELALGRLAWDAGNQHEARSHFEHAMEHFEQAGDSSGIALSLHYLGLVAWKDGRFPEATEHLQHALRRWRELGFQWELTQCIPGHLADVARAAGDLTGALTLYQECLAINRERLDTENMSWSLAGLAMIKLTDRELDEAGWLMALAQRFEALTVAPLTPHIREDHELATREISAAVGQERFAEIQESVNGSDLKTGVDSVLAMNRSTASAKTDGSRCGGLTPRELDVLRMVAAGRSNQEIANGLFVSIGTVKVHVSNILSKLDVKSRVAAADYAHRHGLA